MVVHFINGAISGFAVSTIVSPRFVSCLRRSVVKGFWPGFFTGLGSAIADVLYASIAAFGIFGLSGFLIKRAVLFAVLCGVYLIYVGYDTFFRKPEFSKRPLKRRDLLNILVATFLVTVSNPLSILSFLAMFTGLGVLPDNFLYGLFLIAGIFFGAMVWWTFLVVFGVVLKKRFASDKVIVIVNRISSICIIFFGIMMIVKALFKL